MKEDTSQSRNWYNVANGGGMVSLPADVVDHSVEGIYRRSHCWTIAAKSAQDLEALSPATQLAHGAVLPPPPVAQNKSSQMIGRSSPHRSPDLRPVSPSSSDKSLKRSGNRSSMALGLEAMARPPAQARLVSVHNPNLTFDTILGPVVPTTKKEKR